MAASIETVLKGHSNSPNALPTFLIRIPRPKPFISLFLQKRWRKNYPSWMLIEGLPVSFTLTTLFKTVSPL